MSASRPARRRLRAARPVFGVDHLHGGRIYPLLSGVDQQRIDPIHGEGNAMLKDCTGDTVQSGVTLNKGEPLRPSRRLPLTTTAERYSGQLACPALSGQIKWTASGAVSCHQRSCRWARPPSTTTPMETRSRTYLSVTTTPSGSFAGETRHFSGLGSNKSGYPWDGHADGPHGLGTIKFGKSEGSHDRYGDHSGGFHEPNSSIRRLIRPARLAMVAGSPPFWSEPFSSSRPPPPRGHRWPRPLPSRPRPGPP